MKPSRGDVPKPLVAESGQDSRACSHLALSGDQEQPIPGERTIPGGKPCPRIGERTERLPGRAPQTVVFLLPWLSHLDDDQLLLVAKQQFAV